MGILAPAIHSAIAGGGDFGGVAAGGKQHRAGRPGDAVSAGRITPLDPACPISGRATRRCTQLGRPYAPSGCIGQRLSGPSDGTTARRAKESLGYSVT
jgi:hypothetical protein